MDRLVCGDVGFGKTEVAIRAAFRVAMARQAGRPPLPDDRARAAALPDVRGAHARLPDHDRARCRRFQTKKEQDETLVGLKDGKVDVVIGTHRLLSKDVHFKDLGLLVVDEEQRFGVAHKERIKQLRANVDVLTLTATPIPRTLQMAVGGLRDLSLITTPPVDRRAVRTIVTRLDEQVVARGRARGSSRAAGRSSTSTTASRGSTRRRSASRSSSPTARIAVGHGQMSDEEAAEDAARQRRERGEGRGARGGRCSTSSRGATTSWCRRRSSRAASISRAPTR